MRRGKTPENISFEIKRLKFKWLKLYVGMDSVGKYLV
jgi:hypothetical protein